MKVGYVLRMKKDSIMDRLDASGLLTRVDLVIVPHTQEDMPKRQLDILGEYSNVIYTGPI